MPAWKGKKGLYGLGGKWDVSERIVLLTLFIEEISILHVLSHAHIFYLVIIILLVRSVIISTL